MKNILCITIVIINFLISSVLAFPKEIVIIRHADKLTQEKAGPFLSPKGEVRAIKFASYFLNNFGEPDFIIAKNPNIHDGKAGAMRELQTVAPLANFLAIQHPNRSIHILQPYTKTEYEELAKEVLSDPKYNHKLVLICWDHAYIPKMVRELGVNQPIKKWHSNVYDTVYDLKYDETGKISQFSIKENQYPVLFKGSWETLNKLLAKI